MSLLVWHFVVVLLTGRLIIAFIQPIQPHCWQSCTCIYWTTVWIENNTLPFKGILTLKYDSQQTFPIHGAPLWKDTIGQYRVELYCFRKIRYGYNNVSSIIYLLIFWTFLNQPLISSYSFGNPPPPQCLTIRTVLFSYFFKVQINFSSSCFYIY